MISATNKQDGRNDMDKTTGTITNTPVTIFMQNVDSVGGSPEHAYLYQIGVDIYKWKNSLNGY